SPGSCSPSSTPSSGTISRGKPLDKQDSRSLLDGGLRRRGIYDAIMIGCLVARLGIIGGARPFLPPRGVLSFPVALQPLENVLAPVLEIGPLARILDHVEQELVAGDPQIFPIGVAGGALRSSFVAPVELARMRRRAAQRGREVFAVGRKNRIR